MFRETFPSNNEASKTNPRWLVGIGCALCCSWRGWTSSAGVSRRRVWSEAQMGAGSWVGDSGFDRRWTGCCRAGRTACPRTKPTIWVLSRRTIVVCGRCLVSREVPCFGAETTTMWAHPRTGRSSSDENSKRLRLFPSFSTNIDQKT